jgi:transposase
MLLTLKEQRVLDAIQLLMDSRIGVEEASKVLGISERQVYRKLARVRAEGAKGVVHGNRGRTAQNKVGEDEWERIIGVVKAEYLNINDRHLQEILEREKGIVVGRESLRKRLRGAGIGPKRKRRRKKYRSRRERKPALGMMLQIDGSPHDWLEGRGPRFDLIGAKDDATGYVWARFAESENIWAYVDLMGDVFKTAGLPMSLYSDKHSIFDPRREPTIWEQLNGSGPFTQFGRAMNELGIQIILANSAQAKGRIERHWGISQDRLVVELRLAKASTIEEANKVLAWFLKGFNRRFTVKPSDPQSAFRPAPSRAQLQHILCLKDSRVVANDHTISFQGLVLQLPKLPKYASIASQRVEIRQLRSGVTEVVYKGAVLLRLTPSELRKSIARQNRTVGSNGKPVKIAPPPKSGPTLSALAPLPFPP